MKLPEELQYIQNSLLPQRTTTARVDGKVAVVTGTTSGVGYQAAKKLAAGGAKLVMVCRNPEKAHKVRDEFAQQFNTESECFVADFQRLADVRRAAIQIREAHPKIDILINNIGVFNKRRRYTPDGFEMTFAVIHLASFLFTRLLEEPLKQGAPSRVLFISSEAHRFGGLNLEDLNWRKRPYIGLRAYAAAKIAQLHTARLMAEQLQEDRVSINVLHPGAVRSNIGMNNGFLYRFYQRWILHWFLKDPALAGEAIYTLAADPDLASVTGKFFNQTIEERPAWYAVKPELSQTVWDKSEAMISPYLKGSS
jgi:NAD(P)-dependent dehydrogenase (short-subunit alcohol dehydrogenase family)